MGLVMGNIVLCGFMGCGKTTVGIALARAFNFTFVDMDEYIVDKAGIGIPEIFERRGEEHFRALESQAAAELCRRDSLVISTGGGTVLRPENVSSFKSGGVIVFIDVPLDVIRQRLEGDCSRPLLNRSDKDIHMRELYEKRAPGYLAAADIVVQNSENVPAEAVAEIIARRIAAL